MTWQTDVELNVLSQIADSLTFTRIILGEIIIQILTREVIQNFVNNIRAVAMLQEKENVTVARGIG